MALEDLTGPNKFITALVNTNPLAADDRREGDDHIRGIKNVLHNTFPNLDGQVTATPAALNAAGTAVQRTGDTMTGQLNMKGANVALENGGQVVVADTLGPDRCAMTLAMTGTPAAPVPQIWAGKNGAGAAPVQMNFAGCPRYSFDNVVQAPGSGPDGFFAYGTWASGGNSFANMIAADPAFGSKFRVQAVHVPGQWAGLRLAGDAGSSADFKLNVASASLVLNGPNTVVQATRFAGYADKALYVKNNADPAAGSADFRFNWSDPGGQEQYLLGGPDPYNIRAINRNNLTAGRVQSLEGAGGGTFGSSTCSGDFYSLGTVQHRNGIRNEGNSHRWYWHWNGDVGDNHLYAFVDGGNQGWVAFNSDERGKHSIRDMPLMVDGFMDIRPILFRWKTQGNFVDGGTDQWGFSAQNLSACLPPAVVGSLTATYEHPDTGETLPQLASVDDRVILAQAVLMIQDLQRRVAELERLAAGA